MTTTHSMRLDDLASSLTLCTLSHGAVDRKSMAVCFRRVLDRYGVKVKTPKSPGKWSQGRTCVLGCGNRIINRNKSGVCTQCWIDQPIDYLRLHFVTQDRETMAP